MAIDTYYTPGGVATTTQGPPIPQGGQDDTLGLLRQMFQQRLQQQQYAQQPMAQQQQPQAPSFAANTAGAYGGGAGRPQLPSNYERQMQDLALKDAKGKSAFDASLRSAQLWGPAQEYIPGGAGYTGHMRNIGSGPIDKIGDANNSLLRGVSVGGGDSQATAPGQIRGAQGAPVPTYGGLDEDRQRAMVGRQQNLYGR